MSILFECKDLRKNYGKNQALKGLNLQIESGQIVGLLGPNGSGKTTLIKLANGLLTKNGGELYIDGKEVGVETKKIVSYLPERTYLDVHSKVKDVIEFFKDFYSDFEENRAYDMLSKLNINPNDKLKTMSKGTREKVQLILVMSRQAKLYFLDEPIGGVDPAARDYILNTIISNYNPEADKKFIVLWCPGGDTRPYSAPKTMAKDSKERIYYIRKMSNTVEPSVDEVKDLF